MFYKKNLAIALTKSLSMLYCFITFCIKLQLQVPQSLSCLLITKRLDDHSVQVFKAQVKDPCNVECAPEKVTISSTFNRTKLNCLQILNHRVTAVAGSLI